MGRVVKDYVPVWIFIPRGKQNGSLPKNACVSASILVKEASLRYVRLTQGRKQWKHVLLSVEIPDAFLQEVMGLSDTVAHKRVHAPPPKKKIMSPNQQSLSCERSFVLLFGLLPA